MREEYEIIKGHPHMGKCVVVYSRGGIPVAQYDGYFHAKKGIWSLYPRYSLDGDRRVMVKKTVTARDVKMGRSIETVLAEIRKPVKG